MSEPKINKKLLTELDGEFEPGASMLIPSGILNDHVPPFMGMTYDPKILGESEMAKLTVVNIEHDPKPFFTQENLDKMNKLIDDEADRQGLLFDPPAIEPEDIGIIAPGEQFGKFTVIDANRNDNGSVTLKMEPTLDGKIEWQQPPVLPQHYDGKILHAGVDPYERQDKDEAAIIVQKGIDQVAEYIGRPNDIAFPELIEEMVKYYPGKMLYERTPLYLGIDPGKSGGLVALTPAGVVVGKWIMPILGDNLDVSALYDLFKGLLERYHVTVILEDVHSIFGMSAATNFVFGYVCGAIEAVVLCHKLKLIKVGPRTWQKEIWANGDKVYKPKKPEQKNPSIDTKPTSLCAATRLFPTVDLRKSVRAKIAADGIVDALLLAEYGRRKNL